MNSSGPRCLHGALVPLRAASAGMRHALLFFLLLGVVCCTGCGTMLTRCGRRPFGAYPYQAVCLDCAALFASPPEVVERRPEAWVIWPPSLVGDAVLDTALLPVDLGLWAFGVNKEGPRM